jgi:hypothetical protein
MGEGVASDACPRLAPRALRRRGAAPAPARAVVPHPVVQLDELGRRCPFVLAVAGVVLLNMLTLVGLLSREVGDGFLTCSGNFSHEVVPRLGFGESTFYEHW